MVKMFLLISAESYSQKQRLWGSPLTGLRAGIWNKWVTMGRKKKECVEFSFGRRQNITLPEPRAGFNCVLVRKAMQRVRFLCQNFPHTVINVTQNSYLRWNDWMDTMCQFIGVCERSPLMIGCNRITLQRQWLLSNRYSAPHRPWKSFFWQ